MTENPFYPQKLTKREEFAKAAMQGLLSDINVVDISPDELAEAATLIADALIKKLDDTSGDK